MRRAHRKRNASTSNASPSEKTSCNSASLRMFEVVSSHASRYCFWWNKLVGCDAASAGNVNVCFDDLLLREDLLTHPPTTMCASNSTVAKPESGTLRASRRLGPATKLFWTTSLPGTTSKHLGSCTSTVPAHVATTCSVCCRQPPPSSTPKTTTSPSYRASPPFLTLPTDHNCGSAHLPAPAARRPWTRLCRAPTSNNTPPATPSRHARHPIHPTPQPSHGPTPTPRLRTLLGRLVQSSGPPTQLDPEQRLLGRRWQRPAALASHQAVCTELRASLGLASQAMLQSQSGPYASKIFATIPFRPDTTYPSHLFRVLLLRRLRLLSPLPFVHAGTRKTRIQNFCTTKHISWCSSALKEGAGGNKTGARSSPPSLQAAPTSALVSRCRWWASLYLRRGDFFSCQPFVWRSFPPTSNVIWRKSPTLGHLLCHPLPFPSLCRQVASQNSQCWLGRNMK